MVWGLRLHRFYTDYEGPGRLEARAAERFRYNQIVGSLSSGSRGLRVQGYPQRCKPYQFRSTSTSVRISDWRGDFAHHPAVYLQ